jgi:alginate O-acetyltransferase complex protein AlgI
VALVWFVGWSGALLLALAALLVQGAAHVQHRAGRSRMSTLALAVGGAAALLPMAGVDLFPSQWTPGAIPCATVFACHALSYTADVRRGLADPRQHGAAWLYLVQLPVIVAGPLSRFGEFSQQLARTDVSMASFSYGVRRFVTGIVKVWLIALPLVALADQMFGLPVTRVSTSAAWLGAVCAALGPYFVMSGFSDIGIGVGRIAGIRYQENFRRPYTADSLREFWRRWNITLMAWLRDYLGFPIAGHQPPALRLYALALIGFLVVGGWHQWTIRTIAWAVYFASWLALESVVFGGHVQRLPRVLRHTYVLLVVMFGWMLMHATGVGPLLGYLEAMFGMAIPGAPGAQTFLSAWTAAALVCAIVFAGPLVGTISRWRVSVDAATASLLMMLAATGMLIWHLADFLRRLVFPSPKRLR